VNACPRTARVQDYLDGFLAEADARAFRDHLAGCPGCAAELAAYRRVFAAVADAPIYEPGPSVLERVLDRVSPARRRRRWIRRVGIGYAAALVPSLAGLAAVAGLPVVRGAAEGLWAAASRGLAQGFVLALQALGASVTGVADVWRLATDLGDRFAPLARALVAVLGQSPLGVALGVAALATLALLWWMRSRERSVHEEVRHVGVLAF